MTPTPSITCPSPSVGIAGFGAAFLLLLVPVAVAETPNTPPVPLVESLGQDDLQQAFRALFEHALPRDQLSDLAINRAALAGLLETLGPGVELLPPSSPDTPNPSPPPTNLIASLPGSITYIRPAVLDASLFRSLRDLPKTEAGIVLDLRSPGGELDAARASRFASHFCPPGSPHFSLVDSRNTEIEIHAQDAGILRRPGAIAVLVDSRTSPTAETVAAVLRYHERKRCLLFGETTPGRAAVYETLELGDRARLRFATAGVRLPNGTPVFGKGLVPDLPAASDPVAREALLNLSDPAGLAAFLAEPERPVLNEAALMDGTNPELPELLRIAAADPDLKPTPPLRDAALRQALDFLTARHFLAPEPEDQVE